VAFGGCTAPAFFRYPLGVFEDTDTVLTVKLVEVVLTFDTISSSFHVPLVAVRALGVEDTHDVPPAGSRWASSQASTSDLRKRITPRRPSEYLIAGGASPLYRRWRSEPGLMPRYSAVASRSSISFMNSHYAIY
jgi:hypothetical protein